MDTKVWQEITPETKDIGSIVGGWFGDGWHFAALRWNSDTERWLDESGMQWEPEIWMPYPDVP